MGSICLSGLKMDWLNDPAKRLPEERKSRARREAKRRAVHHVISDTMDAVVHPSNGKYYDSKSQFRAETRARGLTEVGNETIPDRVDRSMPGDLGGDIARAYDELTSRD